MEVRIEASEFGVPALREHLVQAFAIERGFLGELRHAPLSLCHIC